MAYLDPNTPTLALASDPIATLAGVVPTSRGAKRPMAWNPPLGMGQDEADDVAPAPPLSEQARDRWYQAAVPDAAPPQAMPAPAPVAPPPTPPPAASSIPVPRQQATAPAGPPPPPVPTAGGGGASSDPQSWAPIPSTPDTVNQVPSPNARHTGQGDWLTTAEGQLGRAYVWGGKDPKTGFDCSGYASWILNNQGQPYIGSSTMTMYPNTTPVSDPQPGDLVFYNMNDPDPHMQHVAVYIGNGQVIQSGGTKRSVNIASANQAVGSAPEFRRAKGAQPVRQTGASAGVPSGSASGGAAPDVRSGGAAPASRPSAGAPPGVSFGRSTPSIQTSSVSAPDTRGDMGGPEKGQSIQPKTWFSYADHGKEILLLEDASGQTQYLEVGETDEADGTVIDTGTLDRQGQRGQEGVGRGQDEGDSPDDPAPLNVPGSGYQVPTAADVINAQAGAEHTADQAQIQAETDFLRAQQPAPAMTNAPQDAPPLSPILTPASVIGGYQKVGRQPPEQVTRAASQQFAEQQTPESAAATAPDRQIPTDVPNMPGLDVPPQGSPLSRSIQGAPLSAPERLAAGGQAILGASQSAQGAALASGVPQALARAATPGSTTLSLMGQPVPEMPLVAGAIASAFDPLTYAGEAVKGAKAALAPVKNLPKPLQRAFEGLVNGENGANMSSELWRARIEDVLGRPGEGLNKADAASLYEAGHPFTTTAPHPHVAQLAGDMERFANDTGDEGRLLKYIGGDVRNQAFPGQRYFPHVYEDTYTVAQRQARSKGLNPHNFYSNERTYPTLQDAVAAGKQPKNSVSEPFGHYAGAVLKSKARANFINDLKGMKAQGIDVMRPGGARGRNIPEGWVFGGDILPRDPRFNQYWFEPQTAQVLRNITERSTPSATRAVLGISNQFKRSLLGLGTFHLVTEEGQAIGAAGPVKAPKMIARSLWNMWGPNYRKFRLDNIDLFQSAADAGVTLNFGGHAADVGTGPTSRLGQMATRGGVSGAIGGAYGYSQAKSQGASDPDAIRSALVWAAGTGVAAGTMGKAMEQAVFDRAIPTLKVMTYALYKDKYAPTAVASFVNRTYGGNNLAAIGRSPQVQNILRGTLLASDWWEGWVRQMGNFFMPGHSGDLSRKYWGQMVGTAAITLEGMNLVTGGHPTTDNEPGHQLELEVTNLFDKMGWSRRDPSSGGQQRVYWDVLGPLRPLATLAIAAGKAVAGPAGQGVLPGIGDQFGPTAGQFASSRLSPWIDLAAQQASGKDYFGNPLVPPGMDPTHELAMRVTKELGSFEPAPAQQYAQEQRRYGAGPAAIATALGRRLSYSTPVSEEYRQRDDAITRAGGDIQKAQEAVRQRTVEQDRVHGQIADMYRTPGNRTHAQIDQQEMDLRQKVQAIPDIYSDLSGAPISSELKDVLAASVPGTSTSDAPADLGPDMQQQIPTLADSYWRPLPAEQMSSVDPNTQSAVRRQKLQDLATQLGTDPATLLDAFKAQQRGMPMPPLGQGVTSANVESWTSDYVNAGKDSTDPAERSAERGAVIDQIVASHPGLTPDAVQARINLRLTPSVADVPEAEQSHQKALDLLMQGRSAPKYVDESGKPQGTPQQWQQWDEQIKEGERKKGIITHYDPKVQPLKDARDRATALKNRTRAKNPAYPDYQRWFGEGRNMTEDQWRAYVANPSQRWKDNPPQAEAKTRVQVMQFYDTYTPAERRQIKVPALLNGKQQSVPIEAAYTHFKALEVPDWQKRLR